MLLPTLTTLPEANIQAELYHQLRLIGVRTLLEYTINNCRFDMLVLDDKHEHVELIVEIKSSRQHTGRGKRTKQLEKYKEYQLPVLVVRTLFEVAKAVEVIKSYRSGLISRHRLTPKTHDQQVFWL